VAHLLGAEGVHLEYPTSVVFDAVTLGLQDGDRVGIVGRNGDGKSSLLGLLAKTVTPTAGQVTWRTDLRVGLLSQGDAFADTVTVGAAVVGDRAEYEWASDARIREIVGALVTDLDFGRPLGELSGGQRRRVDLAALLVGEWDVLLLDEPTNHLDLGGIDWLARHLVTRWPASKGGLALVTHDRWFLDAVATTTWEVHDRLVEPFEGGYAAYVLQRVERDRQAAAIEAKRQNLLRKELAWLRRGAPARTSKPKFRMDAAAALIEDVPPLRDATALVQLATARLGKTVVDLVGVSAGYGAVTVLRDVTWRLAPGERTGLLGANGAGKSTLLGLLAGAMGSDQAMGSGTPATERALRATAGGPDTVAGGGLPAEATVSGPVAVARASLRSHSARPPGLSSHSARPPGQDLWVTGRIKRGKNTRVGLLDQRAELLREVADEPVRVVLSRLKTQFTVGKHDLSPAQMLERLGFDRHQLSTPVGDLSGGERRRLHLLLVLCQEPNVLILDEPTNDVDTDMLAALEDFLDGWPGTLIVVSHDRYLVERVTDQQFALLDGMLRHLPGGVDEYLALAQGQADPEPAATARPAAAPTDAKRERAKKKELAALERKIAKAEAEVARLHAALAAHDPADYAGLADLVTAIGEAEADRDQWETAWLEAAE
jgi:ATPase subunit of ABC transporter with duplicated ATPase domains